MLNINQAREFANRWIQAWNSREVGRIMSLYSEDAEVVTPAVVTVTGDPRGAVRGQAAVRDFFEKAFKAFPLLHFELIETVWGVNSVVAYYVNHKATRTCEFLELNSEGRIVRSVAHYSS